MGLSYTSVKLRVAFCLLAVTGVRINELLPLRISQLKTLLEEHWIGIDRSKRGAGLVPVVTKLHLLGEISCVVLYVQFL